MLVRERKEVQEVLRQHAASVSRSGGSTPWKEREGLAFTTCTSCKSEFGDLSNRAWLFDNGPSLDPAEKYISSGGITPAKCPVTPAGTSARTKRPFP